MFPVIYTQVVTLLGVLAAGSGGGDTTHEDGDGAESGERVPPAVCVGEMGSGDASPGWVQEAGAACACMSGCVS